MVHQTVRRKFQHMLLASPVHWESQFGTVTKHFQCYNFTPILYGSLKETMYYQQCNNCSRTLTFLRSGLNRLNRWFYFPTTGCIFVLKTFLCLFLFCQIFSKYPKVQSCLGDQTSLLAANGTRRLFEARSISFSPSVYPFSQYSKKTS